MRYLLTSHAVLNKGDLCGSRKTAGEEGGRCRGSYCVLCTGKFKSLDALNPAGNQTENKSNQNVCGVEVNMD
jgi:hypothetical protein